MILARAFYRESARNFLAIALVLLVIFVFIGMSSLLAKAVRGDFADDIVLALLGLQSLRQLDLLLPLAFYLGVLLTFGRWYRDSEMTVLAACGVGIDRLLRPLLVTSLVAAAVVAVLAMVVNPLANRQIEQVKQESARRPGLNTMTPGMFSESAGSRRIFYIEQSSPATGEMAGVFASDLAAGKEVVIVARRGEVILDPATGEKRVRLHDGRIYDGSPGKTGLRVIEFRQHESIQGERPVSDAPQTAEQMPTLALLTLPTNEAWAELHWRLAKPVLVVVLAFWGLLLAHTDIRRGRMGNIFAAILVYFIYSNFLGLGQTLIRQGYVPGVLGLWWVHLVMAGLAGIFLWRRLQGRPLLAWPGRRGRA